MYMSLSPADQRFEGKKNLRASGNVASNLGFRNHPTKSDLGLGISAYPPPSRASHTADLQEAAERRDLPHGLGPQLRQRLQGALQWDDHPVGPRGRRAHLRGGGSLGGGRTQAGNMSWAGNAGPHEAWHSDEGRTRVPIPPDSLSTADRVQIRGYCEE